MLVLASLSFVWAGNWFNNFEKGLRYAKEEGKKMLIYFYSDHCPYCRYMEEFVFGDPEVDEFIKDKFIVVSLSVEENAKLKSMFGVIGTPFVVIYDPAEGKEVLKIFGSRYKEDFLKLLSFSCKKTNLRRC